LMTQELISKHNMAESKTKCTPRASDCHQKKVLCLIQTSCPYKQLVGSLMYVAVCTGPDNSYAVGVLATYMQKPTPVILQVQKGWCIVTEVGCRSNSR
jgi:hypothetical protein